MCIGGLPLIFSGFWGTYKRIEAPIRLYMYYYIICCLVDGSLMLHELTTLARCDGEGSLIHMLVHHYGAAFLCGTLGIMVYFFVALAVACEAYCLWTLKSFTYYLQEGMGAHELSVVVWGQNIHNHDLDTKERAQRLRRKFFSIPIVREFATTLELLGDMIGLDIDFDLDAVRFGSFNGPANADKFVGLLDANVPGPYNSIGNTNRDVALGHTTSETAP